MKTAKIPMLAYINLLFYKYISLINTTLIVFFIFFKGIPYSKFKQKQTMYILHHFCLCSEVIKVSESLIRKCLETAPVLPWHTPTGISLYITIKL